MRDVPSTTQIISPCTSLRRRDTMAKSNDVNIGLAKNGELGEEDCFVPYFQFGAHTGYTTGSPELNIPDVLPNENTDYVASYFQGQLRRELKLRCYPAAHQEFKHVGQ